jgi:hypothetical protein
MMKQEATHKGHKATSHTAINHMETNLTVANHLINKPIIKMVNITTINLLIRHIKIQVNNIVAIQGLMDGRIKNIVKIL